MSDEPLWHTARDKMGIIHLKGSWPGEIKTVEGKRYVWRCWGDPLTSEDLHCSLMLKIWLTLHKNKLLPLSLLCAEKLDGSIHPGQSSPSPSLAVPCSVPTSGTVPTGAGPLAVKLSFTQATFTTTCFPKTTRQTTKRTG